MMQHKVFHHAPQSILSAAPYGHHDQYKHSISLAEASKQRLKRPRKPARKILDSVTPALSASASSWGAADEVEIDAAPSPEIESEEEEATDLPREMKRRRRQLDPGDVGRFAGLSIDRTCTTSTHSSSSSFEIISPTIQIHPIEEIRATSVEEPADEDDIDMRARRGPTTHQIDTNRFYVTSLSDESEDEEAMKEEKRQDQIDAAMTSYPQAQQDGNLIVNGELINRLQAMESHRRHALARDRSFLKREKSSDESGSSTPTKAKAQQQGALILWKSPKELSKEIQLQAQSPATTAKDGAPPVVIEDGDYACVHRPTSPFSFQRSTSASNPIQSADEMEID